jgi:hypothetical protein
MKALGLICVGFMCACTAEEPHSQSLKDDTWGDQDTGTRSQHTGEEDSSTPPTDSGEAPDDTASPEDSAPPKPPPGIELQQGEIITCPTPHARIETPFDEPEPGGDWGNQFFNTPDVESAGGGITVADFTGDGLLDIYLPHWSQDQLLIADVDGTYTDMTTKNLPAELKLASGAATAVDYEGDGDLDLFLCSSDGQDALLENDGEGHFTDVTEAAGLIGSDRRCTASTWADIDGDEDLDFFVSTYINCDKYENGAPVCEKTPDDVPEAKNLWLNNGDGTFSDASDRLPHDELVASLMHVSSLIDVDRDGDMDLFILNDHRGGIPWETPPNLLYLNDGSGQFTRADKDATGVQLEMSSMGIGIGDLNEDGLPDFMISDINRVVMFETYGENFWVDTSLLRNLVVVPDSDDNTSGWGTEMADIDNDGLIDGVMAFGRLAWVEDSGEPGEFDALYLQQEDDDDTVDNTFINVADDWGVADPGMGRGLLTVDLNGDGYLDLIKASLGEPAKYYISRCGDRSWLQVELQDDATANTFGIGAVIEIVADGRTQTRWITAGATSLASSVQPHAHFGLGPVDTVDELWITWPDGEVSVFEDIPARQALTIQRNQ